jgi:hypothetical protein
MHNLGMGILPGSVSTNSVMGSSSASSTSPVAATSAPPPSPPLHHHLIDQVTLNIPTPIHVVGFSHGCIELDHRLNWKHKMDFPRFDGLDV